MQRGGEKNKRAERKKENPMEITKDFEAEKSL